MSTILLPKTQHLVVFQEVIRSGSIGSAAKELGLTQPAVSKIINDIEDYFGVELVVRKNTGVTLTPARKRRFLCMKRNCLRSYRQSATVDWILRLVR